MPKTRTKSTELILVVLGIGGFAAGLLPGCEDPPPPPPPKKPEPQWDAPPPAKMPTGAPVTSSDGAPATTLADLGLKDSFGKFANKPWCREAMGAEGPVYLPPSKIGLGSDEEVAALRPVIAKLPILKMSLNGKSGAGEKASKAEQEKLKSELEAIDGQVAQLGKLAPVQLHLTRGSLLARLGRTDEAKDAFYPIFQQQQVAAGTRGLKATCLFAPAQWPERLFWQPWTKDELPEITSIHSGSAPAEPPPVSTLKTAAEAVAKNDGNTARALDEALRKFVSGRFYGDQEPILAFAVMTVLTNLHPEEARLWEWRSVLAHRMGENGVAKADAARACFLGDSTACVLVQWLKDENLIAIAGDNAHYWPVPKEKGEAAQ